MTSSRCIMVIAMMLMFLTSGCGSSEAEPTAKTRAGADSQDCCSSKKPDEMKLFDEFKEPKLVIEIILGQVRHENNLVNQRITWMLLLQGLLLTSLGLLWKNKSSWPPAIALCLVGIMSCLTVGSSLSAGIEHLDKLNPFVERLETAVAEKFDAVAKEKGLECTECQTGFRLAIPHVPCVYPWDILPWFFAITWVILATYVSYISFSSKREPWGRKSESEKHASDVSPE